MTQDLILDLYDCLHCGKARPATLSIVLVVAHPDDETIGAGAQLPHLGNAHFIHVTDGAPRNLDDAVSAGFTTREDYSHARRAELLQALGLAGVRPKQACALGLVDQEASLHLARLAAVLGNILDELKPDVILTHPYEGGHPDHDATAFAVHACCQLKAAQNYTPPVIFEMASYYSDRAGFHSNEFPPAKNAIAATIALSSEEIQFKRRLFDCFATQQRVLCQFPIRFERFRMAPRYDFTQPPLANPLYYEHFNWGMRGEQWRRLAREALLQLEIK